MTTMVLAFSSILLVLIGVFLGYVYGIYEGIKELQEVREGAKAELNHRMEIDWELSKNLENLKHEYRTLQTQQRVKL